MTSRFRVKRRDGLLLAIFYGAVGVLQLATVAVLDIRMVWIGALAILSLITAYGLFMVRKWSVWLVIGLFFPQVVLGATTLYSSISLYSFPQEVSTLLLDISLVLFITLSLVSFLYVAAKRKTFEPT